jgi:hypothetical protein
MTRQLVLSGCVLSCSVFFVAGCGQEPQQPTHFPVGGRVTLDGKPVTGGDVLFVNSATTGGGPIDAQGNFQVLDEGLKPGLYFVQVTPPMPFDSPPSPNRSMSERRNPDALDFPKRYWMPMLSGFKGQVEPKDNVFEFAMTSEPDEVQPQGLSQEILNFSIPRGTDNAEPVNVSRDGSLPVKSGKLPVKSGKTTPPKDGPVPCE